MLLPHLKLPPYSPHQLPVNGRLGRMGAKSFLLAYNVRDPARSLDRQGFHRRWRSLHQVDDHACMHSPPLRAVRMPLEVFELPDQDVDGVPWPPPESLPRLKLGGALPGSLENHLQHVCRWGAVPKSLRPHEDYVSSADALGIPASGAHHSEPELHRCSSSHWPRGVGARHSQLVHRTGWDSLRRRAPKGGSCDASPAYAMQGFAPTR